MAGRYELWLTDDFGKRLADSRGQTLLDDALKFTATRTVNRIAYFSLWLPPTFDTSLIKLDRMVQVWRAPEGGRLSLWRVYFVRKWRFSTTDRGEQVFVISGPDLNELPRRRIVAAFTGTAQADKTDFADDMMKEIVIEALADGVDPVPAAGTRVWADLSVQANLSNGPMITRAFAFKKLLYPSGAGVLPTIARAAKEAGTEVFFDIVPATIGATAVTYEFRTYTGQPGQDVTGLGVLFDQQKGNMSKPFLEFDYTLEDNYIYAGGQGEGVAREVQQVFDATRYDVSQWNRCEGFADARNQDAANGVRVAGRNILVVGRPRRKFGAVPLDTRGTRFGRDWDFGYKVRTRYRGEEFDSIVRTVTISVDSAAKERIFARLEYED